MQFRLRYFKIRVAIRNLEYGICRKMLVRYRYRKREQKTAAGDRADGEDMQMRRITVEAEGERVRVMLDGQEIQNVQGLRSYTSPARQFG